MRAIGGEGKLTERIGPYRLVERIGEGGMGVVHLGLDPENRTVAVKVLRPGVAGDATARRRLAREVETMRRVHNPHVAEIVDADVNGESPYVVTQYVPGHPLDSAIDERGPLRGEALRKVSTGLASALAAIHGAGIIHRDLKPANVMLVDGSPIVIDFGIAQAVDTTRLTQTGMFIGTPGYLAPEVIQGADVGPPSDIHALAATLIFAATGHPPFGSGGFELIFFKIIQGQPDMTGVPAPMVPLLQRALARDPMERPSAADLVRGFGELDLRDDAPPYVPGDAAGQAGSAYAGGPGDGGGGALGGLAAGAAGLAAGAALGGAAAAANGAGSGAAGAAGAASNADGPAAATPAAAGMDAAGSAGPGADPSPWGPADRPAAGSGPGLGAAPFGGPGPMAADYRSARTPAGPGPDQPAGPDDAATSRIPSAADPDDAGTSRIPGAAGLDSAPAAPPGPPPSDPGPEAEFPTSPNNLGSSTRSFTREAAYGDTPDDYRDVLQPVEYARPRPPQPPPPQRPVASVPPGGYGPPPQPPPGYGRPDPYADPRGRPDPYADPRVRPAQADRQPSTQWNPLLSLLCGIAAVGATIVYPAVALCVILIGLVLLRAIDHATKSLAVRRGTRGPKGSDPLLAVLSTPWGLVRGALVQLLMIPLAAIVGCVVFGVLVYYKPGMHTDTLAAYGAGACAFMLVVGPGSGSPRRGLSRTIGAVARSGAATAVVGLVLAGVALLTVVGAVTAQPSWDPVHVTHKSPNVLVDEGRNAAHHEAVQFVRQVFTDMLRRTFG